MTIRKIEERATAYYLADTQADSDRLIKVIDACSGKVKSMTTELGVYPNKDDPRNPYFVFLLITLQGNDIELFAKAIEYLRINCQTSHQPIKRVKDDLRQRFVERFEGKGGSGQNKRGGKRKRGLSRR